MVADLIVVIPMAGKGSRFSMVGFKTNKYLLPINLNLDKMIEKAIITLTVPNDLKIKYIFVTRPENEKDAEEINKALIETWDKLRNSGNHIVGYEILSLDKLTEGPASTVYEALKNNINEEENEIPLLVSNSDQILDYDFNKFYEYCNKFDGCVLTYRPNYPLIIGEKDKHSFVKLSGGEIVDVSEKIVLGEIALIGVHYYKKVSYFMESYKHMVENDIRAPNNEFYMSLTYKSMLALNKTISYYNLQDNEHFYPVGEPIDYFKYLKLEKPIDIRTVKNGQEFGPVKYKELERGPQIVMGNFAILDGNATINGMLLNYGNIITNGMKIYVNDYLKIVEFPGPEGRKFPKCKRNIFTRGWFVGDFNPSIFITEDFEIGLLEHKKGDKWDYHYHKLAVEYNILIDGEMTVNNEKVKKWDMFVFERNQISCPIFLENCKILCVKIPSIKNDKYII